jgi:hypothetical protein
MNNKFVSLLLAVTAGTAAFVGISYLNVAQAEPNTSFPPLVQRLVDRFNLNENEVNTVMNEFRSENQQQMQNRLEDKLDEGVQAGDITKEQKQLILEKHKTMQLERNNNINLSQEDRRQEMLENREELQKWADENGISMDYFGGFRKMQKGR